MDDHGNWRLIQKEDDHGVVYLETNYGKTKEEIAKENKGLIAGVIILAVTTLFGLVASGCLWCKVSDL